MKRDNWQISIEGIGPTHEAGDCSCADKHMLDIVKALEATGHRILQSRFTSGRGEENWKDPALREMHEGLYKQMELDL